MAAATLKKATKQGQKVIKNKVLHDIYSMVKKSRQSNKTRPPHGYSHKIIAET